MAASCSCGVPVLLLLLLLLLAAAAVDEADEAISVSVFVWGGVIEKGAKEGRERGVRRLVKWQMKTFLRENRTPPHASCGIKELVRSCLGCCACERVWVRQRENAWSEAMQKTTWEGRRSMRGFPNWSI